MKNALAFKGKRRGRRRRKKREREERKRMRLLHPTTKKIPQKKKKLNKKHKQTHAFSLSLKIFDCFSDPLLRVELQIDHI